MIINRSLKEKLSMFKDLMSTATIDGHISREETAFLLIHGKKMGLTDKQMKKVIEKPGKIKYVAPKDEVEKLKHVLRLVYMMLADGKIDRREMAFVKSVAAKLGLNPGIVDREVSAFISRVTKILKATTVQRKTTSLGNQIDRDIEAYLRTKS